MLILLESEVVGELTQKVVDGMKLSHERSEGEGRPVVTNNPAAYASG